MTVHRQLAAIMFTDIVGYTAMMAADEERALDILRKSRDIQKSSIEKHSGKWLKEMGDGVLAQFSSALDAVKCALQIQAKAHSELSAKIRIGIHLGDVTIENEDVFGDGVNIASRLQSIADPGGIYISESINQAIHSHSEINTEYLANVELKNVDRPIKTYYLQEDWLPVPSKSKIKELSTSKQKLAIPIIGFFVILVAALAWFTRDQNSVQSIVVLPISNISGDSSNDILLAGIHAGLRDEIARISALRVISRTSSIKYQDGSKSIPEIAKELKVDAVVESDLYETGDSIRLQVRLIKAEPEENQLWSSTFHKAMEDAPSIYNEVAIAIAQEADISLSTEEITHFTNVQQVNPEAYEAYLKGMGHLYSTTKHGMDRAFEYFNLALEKDPSYVKAYIGVSLVWGFRAQMGYISFKEANRHSEPAAIIAVELDSADSEIHYMLAVSNTWGKWNWEEAEKEFIKTIELDQNHAEALAYYAFYLNIMQRFDESPPQIEKAMELEPFNPLVQSLYGMHLNHTRQFEKALGRLKRTLEEDPGNPIALSTLWTIYHNKGLYEEAYKSALEVYIARGEVRTAQELKLGYEEGGYKTAMERVAEAYILKKDTAYVTSWQLATLYTRADDREEAINWLERALDENDVNMPAISCDPIFDNIEDHPRFQELLAKMRLARNPGTRLTL